MESGPIVATIVRAGCGPLESDPFWCGKRLPGAEPAAAAECRAPDARGAGKPWWFGSFRRLRPEAAGREGAPLGCDVAWLSLGASLSDPDLIPEMPKTVRICQRICQWLDGKSREVPNIWGCKSARPQVAVYIGRTGGVQWMARAKTPSSLMRASGHSKPHCECEDVQEITFKLPYPLAIPHKPFRVPFHFLKTFCSAVLSNCTFFWAGLALSGPNYRMPVPISNTKRCTTGHLLKTDLVPLVWGMRGAAIGRSPLLAIARVIVGRGSGGRVFASTVPVLAEAAAAAAEAAAAIAAGCGCRSSAGCGCDGPA